MRSLPVGLDILFFILYNNIQAKLPIKIRGEKMVSYKKLWKLLIDKDIKKSQLAEMADLSRYTIQKLNRNENVNTDTLTKICKTLGCSFDDIMEITED